MSTHSHLIPRTSQTHLGALANRGVKGFKCFLIESGVDEFPHVTETHLRKAIPELKVGSFGPPHTFCFDPGRNCSKPIQSCFSTPNLMTILILKILHRLESIKISWAPVLKRLKSQPSTSLRTCSRRTLHFLCTLSISAQATPSLGFRLSERKAFPYLWRLASTTVCCLLNFAHV